jgi:lipopolysaccharide biosynthesis protein
MEAVVVAHFHPSGRLATDLYELVRELSRRGQRVVFVSTGLADEGAQRLAPHAQVIRRENFGYDFWSYRTGIEALGDLSGCSRLLICNSSFVTLDAAKLCSSFFEPVTTLGLRGLSASAEGCYHLQSYWISFEGSSLVGSDVFRDWWARMTPLSKRQEVIDRYERGLTEHFRKAGFPARSALVPTSSERFMAICRAVDTGAWGLDASSRQETVELPLSQADILNPTHYLWDLLVARYSVIKLELLRHNPMRVNLHKHYVRMSTDQAYRERIQDALA